jgi:energy-coupling factor transporter transmembrane protein EcfT
MIAEMGMQWVESLFLDFERIQMAEKLKGIRWGLRSIVPLGNILILRSLARGEDTAELLAARGYRHGGTRCPSFRTGFHDLVAGTGVIIVGIAAFFPLVNFLYFTDEFLRGLM